MEINAARKVIVRAFIPLFLLLWVALPEVASAVRKPASDTVVYDEQLLPGKGFYASTYQPPKDKPTLIRRARILTGDGDDRERTDLLILNGLVAKMGVNLRVPSDGRVIDAEGKWVTPGLVDFGFSFDAGGALEWPLFHLSQYRAEQLRALAGGVTTLLYHRFPPSSEDDEKNLALGIVLRNLPNRGLLDAIAPGSNTVLTFVCPASAKGWKHQRSLWRKAEAYLAGQSKVIDENLNLLAGVLKKDVPLHIRCGRADALNLAMAFAQEHHLRYQAVTAASEAYKYASVLAKNKVCASFSVGRRSDDYRRGQVNVLAAAVMDAAGKRSGCAIVQSGSVEDFGQLNLLAGRAAAQGQHLGLDVPPARAIAWITSNPAQVLGIADRVGTIALGRPADLVIWSGNPFAIYTRSEQVFLDGALVWDVRTRSGQRFPRDADVHSRAVTQKQEIRQTIDADVDARSKPDNLLDWLRPASSDSEEESEELQ